MTYTTPSGYTWGIGDDLLKSTHLLIAGTTGSGKSVLINDIMLSILTTKTPLSAALVLIDPKRIELSGYKKLPFCRQYVQEARDVTTALHTVIDEMESRYKQMEKTGARMWKGGGLYVIIDELADLMISEERTAIRRLLQKILQLGRAADIHVIAATQAPNRKVIPAELVLNFTDRVALRCLSHIESRQIIGVGGAERLPRYGRGLYQNAECLRKVAIPFTEERELQSRINFWSRA